LRAVAKIQGALEGWLKWYAQLSLANGYLVGIEGAGFKLPGEELLSGESDGLLLFTDCLGMIP
jgi:hypothetical protein